MYNLYGCSLFDSLLSLEMFFNYGVKQVLIALFSFYKVISKDVNYISYFQSKST